MEHKDEIVDTVIGLMTLENACKACDTNIHEFDGWELWMIRGWFEQFIDRRNT